MLSHCPWYYYESKIFQTYLQAVGVELDQFALRSEEILESFFIQISPEWGLLMWEQELAITSSSIDSDDLRRSRILAKLAATLITTEVQLKIIVDKFLDYGASSIVKKILGENAFEIKVPGDNIKWYESMIVSINKIKPAHLRCILTLKDFFNINTNSNKLSLINNIILLEDNNVEVPHLIITQGHHPWSDKIRFLNGSWLLDGSEILGYSTEVIIIIHPSITNTVLCESQTTQSLGINVESDQDISKICIFQSHSEECTLNLQNAYSYPIIRPVLDIEAQVIYDHWSLNGSWVLDGVRLLDEVNIVESL